MISIMLKLGEFKFSISTAAYQSFTRSTAYRWQAQERYGQLPAQQYTGPGDDSISLSGDIYPDYAGGLHQLDSMRQEAAKGRPLLLVDGNGYIHGRWVILSIEDAQAVFFSDGTPRKMAFSLKIAQYVDDFISGGKGSVGIDQFARDFFRGEGSVDIGQAARDFFQENKPVAIDQAARDFFKG